MSALEQTKIAEPAIFTHVDTMGGHAPAPFDPAGPAPAPAAEQKALPAPARRRRFGVIWSNVSSLVTGAIAFAGLATLLLLNPAKLAGSAAPAAPVEALAKPPTISVAAVHSGAITETVVVTGNLVPREEVLVSPQIDGYAVEEILVEEGDRVKQGQVLARLSRTMIDTSLAQNAAQIARADAAIAQAQSSIDDAKASKDQASSAFARTQTLRKDGNATTDVLEQRQATALSAAARLDSAEHALTVAQADKNLAVAQRDEWMVRVERTEIKAPAAGVISRRTARVGAIASSAGDALFRIIRDGDIELEADVPEAILARLQLDMKAQVVTVGGKEPVPAHVRLVSPEVNQTTRLGKVRVAIDNASGLKIGAFGRATVEIDSRTGVLVPQSAVLYSVGGPTVQVLKDHIIQTRPVTIGLRTEKQVEIEKGLVSGEWVVATAGTFVRDGDKVIGRIIGGLDIKPSQTQRAEPTATPAAAS